MENRDTVLGIGAGCVILTLIFLVAGFPYDRLESRVVRGIEQVVGGEMTYAESEQSFGLTGPAYAWYKVRITGNPALPLDLERLSARLAWSLSWLRLAPAFHIELEGPIGNAEGVVTLGNQPGFDGTLDTFDLGVLPPSWTIAGISITGLANAEIDLRGGDEWMGDVNLAVANGNLSGGQFRAGLPFDELTGTFALAGDHRTEITALHVESPLMKADVTGSIGPGPTPGEAPLDLAVELDADIRATSILRGFGIRLTQKGPQSLTVSGTMDDPKVR